MSTPEPPAPTPSATTCNHCWHQWGSASGGVSSEGSWSKGTNRCCHCGAFDHYEFTTKAAPPPAHGPYYLDIVRFPA